MAVVALVALRLALGFHFLYEGVWKIDHSDVTHAERWKADRWRLDGGDAFTARPFLALAKGPVSGLFYAMLPDVDGRQRLKVVGDPKAKAKKIDSSAVEALWEHVEDDFIAFYQPGAKRSTKVTDQPGAADKTNDKAADKKDKAAKKDGKSAEKSEKDVKKDDKAAEKGDGAVDEVEKFVQESDRIRTSFTNELKKYLAENADDIAEYFASLDRFENDPERNQTAPYQKERRWNRMMELRGEADRWVKDIERLEYAYVNALYSIVPEKDRAKGVPTDTWNPLKWDRMKQLNVMVTFSLAAIGLCLMLGFCTPLAALGGAGFMAFVVMTQPAFPTIFPHDPPVVGHALLVNKDFVEMVALLVVAATCAGRWGGLDFFVVRWVVRPFCNWWQNGKKK